MSKHHLRCSRKRASACRCGRKKLSTRKSTIAVSSRTCPCLAPGTGRKVSALRSVSTRYLCRIMESPYLPTAALLGLLQRAINGFGLSFARLGTRFETGLSSSVGSCCPFSNGRLADIRPSPEIAMEQRTVSQSRVQVLLPPIPPEIRPVLEIRRCR